MLIVATAVAAALSGGAPVIDASARGVDRTLLLNALTVPEAQTNPRGKRRYCFDDRITDPTAARRVCRTLTEWRRLGLEPFVS